MARLPRLEWPGQLHYLILSGHGALAAPGVFTDAIDRQAFTEALRDAATAEGVQVHAYALLPDEAQLLVTPPGPGATGRLMQAVGRRYVSAYNRRHRRRGSLWAGRYRAAVVEAGELSLAALCLVDGASAEPEGTSAGSRTGLTQRSWLTDPPEVWALGNTPFEREAAYRDLLARGVPAPLAESLRRAALGGWALGSPAFLDAATQATARPAAARPRGRPRKPA
ncbi:MAG: transposase [Leptothrix sp. (in: Bacteria)]|nr:transposase [Leptothrix sp. (in: b-proteobacteria)]